MDIALVPWSPSTSHDTQSNIGSISGSIFDRNTKSFVAEPSIESFFVGPISTLPIVSMPADTESVLFAYCGNQLLPSLIHRQAHARYLDFSYWSSMAMTHEPLMDAALACAAASLSWKTSVDTKWRLKMRTMALEHYTSAVISIREAMGLVCWT
jgi:hypothetical protein